MFLIDIKVLVLPIIEFLFLTFSLPHLWLVDSRYSITFAELKWNEIQAVNISKSKRFRRNLGGGHKIVYGLRSDNNPNLSYEVSGRK